MNNLDLGLDIQEICINGDESKKISFCPSDINIVARYKECLDYFENLQKQFEETSEEIKEDNAIEVVKKLSEIDKILKEKIDYIFNAKISEVVFGDVSCFTRGLNDRPIFQNVIESLIKYCTNSYNAKVETIKNSEKANQYLSKYRNKYVKNNDFKKSNKYSNR